MSARYLMGTFLTISAFGAEAEGARLALFERTQELEERLSFFREDSDVSRVNRAAGGGPVAVSREAFDAVHCALRLAETTDGAFDPTFRSEGGGDFKAVRLEDRTISLAKPGMLLDLGGIGKGWALDRALHDVLPAYDVSRLAMDFGGQLLFWSDSGRFYPREIAIEDPRDGRSLLSNFRVDRNCSIATSSQSQRPGHLRDPRTGQAASGCLSATAVAESGAAAEALSTAAFVLGPAAAPRLLERFPEAKVFLH